MQVQVSARRMPLGESVLDDLRCLVRSALRGLQARIDQVSVTIESDKAAPSRLNKRCQIQATLDGRCGLIVEGLGADVHTAIAEGLRRVKRTAEGAFPRPY